MKWVISNSSIIMKNTLIKLQKGVSNWASLQLHYNKWLSPFRVDRCISAAQGTGEQIHNLRVLTPAQAVVPLGVDDHDRGFLQVGKYFNNGSYSRPDLFVCEVPQAYYYNGTGMVCTKDFEAVIESQMKYRLELPRSLPALFKPWRPRRLAGTYATIQNCFWYEWWHWLVDSLPRVYSLYLAYPVEKVVLLVPDDMGPQHVDSLASVLPPNFSTRGLPRRSWVQVDRMLLPSYVSDRGNGHLPKGYYDFIRKNTFSKFGLPGKHIQTERIYVSRRHTKRRRITNEPALISLLERYGFRTITPENLSFREQVELFHRAEVIVAPHGSNWGNIIFSGAVKILVLYPDAVPETHIFTVAKALGQKHFFLAGNAPHVNSDFSVDVAAVERILTLEMELTPVPSGGKH